MGGERLGPVAEEGPHAVLDDRQAQFAHAGRQLPAAVLRHGRRRRVVQGRLQVQRRQRCPAVGRGHGVGKDAVRVPGERDQDDAEPRRDLLDQGIGQRVDAHAAAGPDQRRQGSGDGLPGVAGEQDPAGGGAPSGRRQQGGGGLARGRCARGGHGPGHVGEHVGAQQRCQAGRDELRLSVRRRVVEFQIDPRGAGRLGQCPAGRHRRGPHEGAAADLSDDQSAPDEFGVDAAGRGRRDPPPACEDPLRGQASARCEPPAEDVGGDPVGDPLVVVHGTSKTPGRNPRPAKPVSVSVPSRARRRHNARVTASPRPGRPARNGFRSSSWVPGPPG